MANPSIHMLSMFTANSRQKVDEWQLINYRKYMFDEQGRWDGDVSKPLSQKEKDDVIDDLERIMWRIFGFVFISGKKALKTFLHPEERLELVEFWAGRGLHDGHVYDERREAHVILHGLSPEQHARLKNVVADESVRHVGFEGETLWICRVITPDVLVRMRQYEMVGLMLEAAEAKQLAERSRFLVPWFIFGKQRGAIRHTVHIMPRTWNPVDFKAGRVWKSRIEYHATFSCLDSWIRHVQKEVKREMKIAKMAMARQRAAGQRTMAT